MGMHDGTARRRLPRWVHSSHESAHICRVQMLVRHQEGWFINIPWSITSPTPGGLVVADAVDDRIRMLATVWLRLEESKTAQCHRELASVGDRLDRRGLARRAV